MIYLPYIGALLLGITSYASAHSWVACTDYRGDINYYQDSKCFGYPRNWKKARGIVPAALTKDAKGYHIGVDTGYEYKPSQNAACQYAMSNPYTAAYTSDYPMATYEKGNVYCLAWPTKNHAAATCTNQYIPDNQLKLFVSNKNPKKDPTQSAFKLRNVNGIEKCRGSNAASCALGKSAHVNQQIDCEGFQRSPKFCEYTDKALAHACFEVPSWFADGHYVFQWYWEFNSGEFYSTCWDAKIVGKGKGPKRSVALGTKGTAQTTLCQGGYKGKGDCKCANNYNLVKPKYLRAAGLEAEDEIDFVDNVDVMEQTQEMMDMDFPEMELASEMEFDEMYAQEEEVDEEVDEEEEEEEEEDGDEDGDEDEEEEDEDDSEDEEDSEE